MRLPLQVEGVIYTKGKHPKFLLLKRAERRGGFWQPVSGGVEDGETLQAAVLREVAEETGIVTSTVIDSGYIFQFKDNELWTTEYVFGIPVETELITKLSEEHTEFRW